MFSRAKKSLINNNSYIYIPITKLTIVINYKSFCAEVFSGGTV